MLSSIPEVPPNWIKVRFDEIATNVTDRIEKPNESDLEYYIGLEHLDTDQIRIKRFGSTEDVKATKFLCKKGDIIFGKRNSYLRKVAVTDRDAVVSAHSMVIRPKGDLIVPDFLPCFMQSNVFWKTAHAISEGSMSPTIKWKTLAKQEFWIPSIEEQKKIVETIWSIQDNIEKNDELIRIAEKLKKGMLNELLTKGIGHKHFKKTELGEIPVEWDIKKIEDICDIIIGRTPKRKNPEYWNNDSKNIWVTIKDLNSKYITESQEKISDKAINECKMKLIPKDTLLMSFKLTIGKLAFSGSDLYTNEAIVAFLPNEKIISKYFLYYALAKLEFESHCSLAVKGKTLNKKKLNNLVVLIPNITEQLMIVKKMNSFEEAISNYKYHLFDLTNLKKKLTNEFLSGKLRIPEGVLENVQ